MSTNKANAPNVLEASRITSAERVRVSTAPEFKASSLLAGQALDPNIHRVALSFL
jgi:hypothetical protein